MKRKKVFILTIILSFFLIVSSVYAALSVTLARGKNSDGTWKRASYGSHSTSFYYTTNRTSTVYNAFCVEPNNQTADEGTYTDSVEQGTTVHEITEESKFEGLVRALYYAYNAPGWSTSPNSQPMHQWYDDSFCYGSECGEDLWYAYSHVVLSYYYHKDVKADNGWNSGIAGTDYETNAIKLANYITDFNDPPSGFHAYIITNGKQDIVYWTYSAEACVRAKKVNGLTNKKLAGAKIGLYKGSSHTLVKSKNTTTTAGEVKFSGLEDGEDYYVHEIEAPEGYDLTDDGYYKVTAEEDCPTLAHTFENYPYYYCIKVKKVDKNSTSTLLNGATFSFSGGGYSYTGTTPAKSSVPNNDATSNTALENGYYIVDMIPYSKKDQNYTFTETNSNGDELTVAGTSTKYKYWNTAGTVTTTAKPTVMQRSGKKYTCTANTNTVTAQNKKQYFCAKVRKIDKVTQTMLPGATFKSGNTTLHDDGNGYYSIFTGTSNASINVTETKAPDGYAKPSPDTLPVTPYLLSSSYADESAARSGCLSSSTSWASSHAATDFVVFEDAKLLINWYKYLEDYNASSNTGTKADKANFVVSHGSKYVQTSGTESVTDINGVTKLCYKYSGLVDTASQATVFPSGGPYNNDGTRMSGAEAGGVCITGLEEGDYYVYETKPADNHTFSTVLFKKITARTVFDDKDVFINEGTYIEVEKQVTDPDRVANTLDNTVLKKIETNKLKKIPFEIYKVDGNGNATGNPINLVLYNGVYYDSTAADVSGTSTTTVYLNDDRRIKLSHLAWGNYVLKEKGHKTSDACSCTSDPDCIGYYFPKPEQEVKFTITKCSNVKANMTEANRIYQALYAQNVCTVAHPADNLNATKQDNTPTELWFTKKDFYDYEDSGDIADEVNFVDNKERSDFDRITFKVKDSSGNYLKFIDIGNHITDSNNICLKDDDYHEYRYITDAELNALTAAERSQLKIVTELHTCGGHIRITNLCRGKKYKVEEVSVPEDSVFTLPEDGNPSEVEYEIPCCDDTTITPKTSKTIIKDKGTRVRFEKRDSKYNYLIPDETTTFRVYQCEKGKECHPTSNISDMAQATDVRKEMVFRPRAALTKKDEATPITYDEEDGKNNGSVIVHAAEDYENVYEVYKAVSDSDKQHMTECTGNNTNNCYVKDLHPNKGVLILRYLPAGYNYVLVETKSPNGYSLPDGTNRETSFTVTKDTVKVEEVNVPNVPVSLVVRKYTADGNLLEGATFSISKAKNCNMNIAPNKVETTGILNLKTIRDGIYEVRPTGDTTLFKTCTDREGAPCNDINNTLTYTSQNAYENYENTFADYQNLVNSRLEPVPIEAGEALIQYLDYGGCYIIQEVQAPKGYSLPENEEDRFTMVKVTDKAEIVDTYEAFVNTPTPFSFYKQDEYGKPLDGAKYKLQKLNDAKKYVDVAVSKDDSFTDQLVYKVDPDSTNYIMETQGGKATITYLEEGQYRVLEVEAPEGYELPKKTMNVATFFVDKDGKVYGSSIIANKPKTEKIKTVPEAKATFIVNIQTGQVLVRYGLIISVIVLAIAGLLYVQRKNKK